MVRAPRCPSPSTLTEVLVHDSSSASGPTAPVEAGSPLVYLLLGEPGWVALRNNRDRRM